MSRIVFHLVANAHLDPVWLWDWRDGLNEGIITCRTMLDLMDEDPDFTFIRGEAAIYQHIQHHDPETWARIAARVREGRWDVVGGTWIQPDTNLPATETFVRHYQHGQRWLANAFGKPVRAAWAADSFGHAAGLPDIMAASGIEGFAFTRPEANILPMSSPAFWWEGPAGGRVLNYRPLVGWYGSERHEVAPKLDKLLAYAKEHANDAEALENFGFFYGLGNHGGGATRRHLAELRAWAASHPEVEVVHSGLHRLFAAITAEIRAKSIVLPVHRGEMNFTLRGCYASVAKFKFPYRKAEHRLAASETLDALAANALGHAAADLTAEWEGVLFNSFHDVLPGSSIERAYDDQLAWLGGITHRCSLLDLKALNLIARRIDTRVPKTAGDHPNAVPVLLWNPHPFAWEGHAEFEANLDYRPIWPYQNNTDALPVEVRDADGAPLAHQIVLNEHAAMTDVTWRKRVVVPTSIPPLGWRVMTIAWVEGPQRPEGTGTPATASAPGAPAAIANGRYRVAAAVGDAGLAITLDGAPLTSAPIGAAVFDDLEGSWGGADGPEHIDLTKAREHWQVTAVDVREHGPERAALWVRLAGARSRLDLTIQLWRGRPLVEIHGRLLWNERASRLRLLMAGAASAVYEVPAGAVERGPVGDVPGLNWALVKRPGGGFGLVTDSLSSYTVSNGMFSATVARASRYAASGKVAADAEPWRPAVDCGELQFRFGFCPADAHLPAVARAFSLPLLAQIMPAKPAQQPALPKTGSFAQVAPATLTVLALKPAADGDGLILRVQETTGAAAHASFTLFGTTLDLGPVAAGTIATWRLRRAGAAWAAVRTDLLERPLTG
jgi:alpha-mannosidase